MAFESQGILLVFSTSSANSTVVTAAIEEVTGFSGPSGSASIIDVTSLDSTAKMKLIGLRDEGNITIDLNFIATAAMQTKLRDSRAARTESNLSILFNDTGKTAAHMKCFVTGFTIGGSVDNKVTGSVTIEINGPVTWATYT